MGARDNEYFIKDSVGGSLVLSTSHSFLTRNRAEHRFQVCGGGVGFPETALHWPERGGPPEAHI